MSEKRPITIQLLLACLLLSFLQLAACKKEEDNSLLKKKIPIRLIHSPELTALINERKDIFNAAQAAQTSETIISIETKSEPAIAAARKLADGELKADAWIAPSLSLVNYSNTHLRNLGPKQIDCWPLFRTPLVLATNAMHQKTLGSAAQSISWNELVSSRFILPGTEDLSGRNTSFSHGTPETSAFGWAALTQLAYWASSIKSGELDLDSLKSALLERKLKEYELNASNYSSNDTNLIARLRSSSASRIRLSITTEQQLAHYNLTHKSDSGPLIALYPSEGTFWQEYVLCTSDADWVTPANRAAIRVLYDALSNDAAQLAAQKFGFRPIKPDLPVTAPLTSEYGVDLSYPAISLPEVQGPIISYIIEMWNRIRRPAASVLVLDTSGSMGGNALNLGQTQFRNILARNAKGDVKSLLTFNTTPLLQSKLTDDVAQIIPKLDLLQSIGGSAVYDSLRLAIELLNAEGLKAYRKSILLFTDGQDKNSNLSLQGLLGIVEEKVAENDVNLIIIGVSSEGKSYTDMQKLAQVGHGIFVEANLEELAQVFESLTADL